MLERNRGAFSETVLSREVYFHVGGHPPTHATADDWILFLNVARLAEWHTLAEPLAFQRLHSRQTTASNTGLFLLSAKVGAWLTGRAFPYHLDVDSTVAQLARYGTEYRWVVRQFLWRAIRSRDRRQAALVGALAAALLPRWRDRFYVLVPPVLVHRGISYEFDPAMPRDRYRGSSVQQPPGDTRTDIDPPW